MPPVSPIQQETQKSDDELIEMLDDRVAWKMITGNPVMFSTYRTLRDALRFTYDISMSGKSPGPLSTLDGGIYIDLPQIYGLWKRLNIIKS